MNSRAKGYKLMSYMPAYQERLAIKNAQIAYLKAVCRIAADKLRDGGTFPINGETWSLLDFAAGEKTKSANPPSEG